jgi:2-iminobutanoate/2-iminopropanoate deaminase
LKKRFFNSADAPPPNAYNQAVEIEGAKRILFISGQIPADKNNVVPDNFRDQAKQAWANVEAQLRAAGMTFDDLVKVTMFLSDRKYTQEGRLVRKEVLGERAPALTVIIAGIFDEKWLLEIEAIAAA